MKKLHSNSMEKYFFSLASIVLTVYLIILARPLFIPVYIALLLSIALLPVVKLLERYKLNRLVSVLLVVLLLLFVIVIFLTFFSFQIATLNIDLNNNHLAGMSSKAQNWLMQYFGLSPIQLLREYVSNFMSKGVNFLKSTMSITTNVLAAMIIFLITLFFFLFYRRFLTHFLYQLFSSKEHDWNQIFKKIQSVVVSYVLGVSSVIIILAVLNTTGLVLLGIENAFLFGTFAAVLNLIPFLGVLIGSLIPAIFALLTKSSLWYPLGVIIIFMSIQFLESYFLTPFIVGRQVQVNPFIAILGIFVGGMLLGIVGIIFALPTLAIMKTIFDEIPSLKPWGYLIGEPHEED